MKINQTIFRPSCRDRYFIFMIRTILLFCCFTAFSMSPTIAFSQNEKIVIKQDVTISVNEIFDLIIQQTNYNFIYSQNLFLNAPKVNLKKGTVKISDLLEKCVTANKLEFSLAGNNTIVIKPSVAPIPRNSNKQIEIQISGTVTDAKGLAIPGVSVTSKKTKNTEVTDLNGQFTIQAAENDILQFSYIGYKTKEFLISNEKQIKVILEEDVTELQAVKIVSTGIYTRNKESFIGAASTFTAAELRTIGNQNLIQSLKILDPSFVQIDNIAAGSNPNILPDVQIRGANSLPSLGGEYANNPNSPLFILDGFETTLQKIYDLDMNRVAAVTILKDAAAKAIYGSRAANGVVVIETKRPQKGKLRVSYTGDLNVTAPDLSSYHLTNAEQKLQVELDAGRYSSNFYYSEQLLKEQYNRTYTEVARGVNTYWLSQPLTTAVGHKSTLSLEGGDDNFTYGADLTYNSIPGVMKESGRRTTSGNIFLSYRVSDFIFRNILTVTGNHAYDSPYGSFSEYTRLNPYWTPYDDNGNIKKLLGQFNSGSGTPINYYNPLFNATLGTKNFNDYTDITNNFQAEWSVSKALKIVGRIGYTQISETREDFYPANHTRYAEYSEADFYRRGDYTITDGKSHSIKTDLTLNYSKTINKHLFYLNAGWNLYEVGSESHGVHAQGFLNDRVDYINFARQYAQDERPSGSDALTRETGLLSALNYSYDDRYLADLTYRLQGSSIFGADNRWGSFWSVGLGWNIHKEKFFKQDWITQLKLRTSTGYTGSQNFNPYQAMATYNYFTDSYYDNIVGAKLIGLANDQLKWQQTQDYNFGLDLGLWSKLSLRFDYYISLTNNLLTQVAMPGSVGFSTISENLGEIRNNGVDATLNYKVWSNPSSNSFVNLFLNVGSNKNKLVKISNALNSVNDELEADRGASTKPFVRYQEGKSTTAIWAVPSMGIDPATGSEIFVKKNGELTYVWDPNDQAAVGESTPKARGSFGFNAQYRGFGVNCAFSYRLGGQYYNQTLVDRVENVDIQYNVDERVFTDTWKNPGDNAFFKAIGRTPTRTNPSSRFVQDLDELLLNSVNVSYDFRNKKFLEKSRLSRLRVTLFGNDLARMSTIRAERGLDFPFARTFSFSVQASF